MKQSQILVFSIALGGYSHLFKNCIKSHKKYCSKYNFDYVVINKEPFPLEPNQAGWLKLFLLREALKCDYNWICFIDADCEIRRHAPDFRSYLDQLEPNASTYMAHGFSGRINSGVIFMKNTPDSAAYLNEVLNNRNQPVAEVDKAPFENGHMIKFGKNNPSVKIIDNSLWNNNVNFDLKSYIQHYSGGILRPFYLRNHPVADKLYWFKKRWKMHQRKYQIDSNSKNLENALPWLKERYPEFNYSN